MIKEKAYWYVDDQTELINMMTKLDKALVAYEIHKYIGEKSHWQLIADGNELLEAIGEGIL